MTIKISIIPRTNNTLNEGVSRLQILTESKAVKFLMKLSAKSSDFWRLAAKVSAKGTKRPAVKAILKQIDRLTGGAEEAIKASIKAVKVSLKVTAKTTPSSLLRALKKVGAQIKEAEKLNKALKAKLAVLQKAGAPAPQIQKVKELIRGNKRFISKSKKAQKDAADEYGKRISETPMPPAPKADYDALRKYLLNAGIALTGAAVIAAIVVAIANADDDPTPGPKPEPEPGPTPVPVGGGDCGVFNRVAAKTLKKTAREATIEIQQLLIKLGYKLPKHGADGRCGPETMNAVKAFQRDAIKKGAKLGSTGPGGDGVDGVVGPLTYALMKKGKAAPTDDKKEKPATGGDISDILERMMKEKKYPHILNAYAAIQKLLEVKLSELTGVEATATEGLDSLVKNIMPNIKLRAELINQVLQATQILGNFKNRLLAKTGFGDIAQDLGEEDAQDIVDIAIQQLLYYEKKNYKPSIGALNKPFQGESKEYDLDFSKWQSIF